MATRRRKPRLLMLLLLGMVLGGLWVARDRKVDAERAERRERAVRTSRAVLAELDEPGGDHGRRLEDIFHDPAEDARLGEARPPRDDIDEPMPVAFDVQLVHPDDQQATLDAFVEGRGCTVMGRIHEGRGRAMLVEAAEDCAVRALVTDGFLSRYGEWLDLDLDRLPASVELVVPLERQGGLGVTIGFHEDGIIVDEVYPGTAAARLGLRPGDVIVEVDGIPTTALALRDFVEVATGPEGSRVELVISRETDTGFVETSETAVRGYMDEETVGPNRGASAAGGNHVTTDTAGGPLEGLGSVDDEDEDGGDLDTGDDSG